MRNRLTRQYGRSDIESALYSPGYHPYPSENALRLSHPWILTWEGGDEGDWEETGAGKGEGNGYSLGQTQFLVVTQPL